MDIPLSATGNKMWLDLKSYYLVSFVLNQVKDFWTEMLLPFISWTELSSEPF